MFQPVVPLSGLAGWSFLHRTRAAQQAAFDTSAQMRRETEYFRQNVGAVKTAGDLVADRRLLQVALGAFGLEADIDSRFFVGKVLQDGTLTEGALANRLSDKRYFEMAHAFGFDRGTPSTVLSDFGDQIAAKYRERQFEVAVGRQSESLRLALAFPRAAGRAGPADDRGRPLVRGHGQPAAAAGDGDGAGASHGLRRAGP